jgi:hypothetical protein
VCPSGPAPSSDMVSGCESNPGRNMFVTCAETADEAHFSELLPEAKCGLTVHADRDEDCEGKRVAKHGVDDKGATE